MKHYLTFSMIGLAVLFCIGSGRAAPATPPTAGLPEVTVGVVSNGPVLDGALDDPCWAAGGVITNFSVWGAAPKSDPQTFRILTDGKWLYLGGEIQHPKPSWIKPACLDHDGPVHADDAIEWFIDPGTKGEMYYHFIVNAANVRGEQRVTKEGKDRQWNVAWRSAAKVTARGWVVEAALPMSVLAAYGDLNIARMNLCVTRVVPVIDPQAVRVGETRESLTWSPVLSGFHEPERFGVLKGLDAVKVSEVYLPRFAAVKVGRYDIQGKALQYGVNVQVRNDSALDGMAEVVVEDHPLTGKGAAVTAALQQTGQNLTATNMIIPANAMGDRWVLVTLKVNGEEWDNRTFKNIADLRAMQAYLDRNYYTTEEQGQVIAEFGFPDEALQGKTLKVIDETGRLLGTVPAAKTSKAGFELKTLKEGTSKLAVELSGSDGQVICRQEVPCVKRPPKPGFEWKKDQENRVILRDGKPFFLRCISTSFDDFADMEAGMRDMQATGFNAIMFAARLDPTNTAYLDLAAKHDLLVIPWMESYGERRTNYNGNLISLKIMLIGNKNLTRAEKSQVYADEFHYQLPRFLEATRRIKDHPNFLAYFIFDEPMEKNLFDMVTPGRECYQKLIEADGYHPVMVNYSSYIPEGDEYVDWCDVLCTDPYWVPPAAAVLRTTPNWVSKCTVNTLRRAEVTRNPIWIVPMAELWSGCYKRVIAPQEQFCQTYLALIHGAKGLIYFTFPMRYQFVVDALKAVNDQLKTLAPIVLSPSVKQIIAYSPGEFDPSAEKYPDVQAALFRHPEGGFVLLAANSRPYPVETTFKLSNLGKEKVQQVFAKWRANAKDSSFKDRIEPYGVRAYRYDGKGDKTEPVNVALTMKAQPDAITPEPAPIPVSGRAGKKNLVQNPGFELATLPGAPDYFPLGPQNLNGPRAGQPGAWFELDTSQPFEGKCCLRLKCATKTPANITQNMVRFKLSPKCDKPTTFVFSAYMRADRDGVQATLVQIVKRASGFGDAKPVTLTKAWQRYSASGDVAVELGRYNMFGIIVTGPADGFTVWVDALQFEPGAEPTDYEP